MQDYDVKVLGYYEEIPEDEPYSMDGDGSLFRVPSNTIFYDIYSNLSEHKNKIMDYDEFTEFVAKNENLSQTEAYKLVELFANSFAAEYHNSASFSPTEFGFTVTQ